MKIVEALLVRDEMDVIEAHIAFQLNAGVDFIVAVDHASTDGTSDVLERYAGDGLLRRIPEQGELREVDWRTRAARLAATEHGADWVVNSDADQFWWPRRGGLREVLSAVPGRYGAVQAFDRVFVPRPFDGTHFAERMIHRLTVPAAINAPTSALRPVTRIVHRGDPRVVVSLGSHAISGAPLEPIAQWHPIEVLHFPWRSPEQMARKATHFARGRAGFATGYHSEAYRSVSEGQPHAHYSGLAVSDAELERGLVTGAIGRDTRVRDALRLLAEKPVLDEEPNAYALGRWSAVAAPAPSALDDAGYASEAEALREATLVRVRRRLDSLEQRLRVVEPAGRTTRVAAPPR